MDDSDNDDGDDQWREEMEDREFLVQEAMRRIPLNVDVPIDLRPSDIKDDQLVGVAVPSGMGGDVPTSLAPSILGRQGSLSWI